MPRCWSCQRTQWQRIVTLRDALLEEVGSLLGTAGGRPDVQAGSARLNYSHDCIMITCPYEAGAQT